MWAAMIKALIENISSQPLKVRVIDGSYIYVNTDIVIEVGCQQEVETDVFYVILPQLLDLEQLGSLKIVAWPAYTGTAIAGTETISPNGKKASGMMVVTGSSYVGLPTYGRPSQIIVEFVDAGSPDTCNPCTPWTPCTPCTPTNADTIDGFARMVDGQWTLLMRWSIGNGRMRKAAWSYVIEPPKHLNTENLRSQVRFKEKANASTLI